MARAPAKYSKGMFSNGVRLTGGLEGRMLE